LLWCLIIGNVAADNAQFKLRETKAGIIGECGVMHRAIRQLPYRIALTMILNGDRLPARDALAFGLVNEVVPFSGLSEEAMRWAEKLSLAAPLAVQAAKEAVLQRLDFPLELALTTKFESIEAYSHSEDRVEGRKAFSEKRKQKWSGR